METYVAYIAEPSFNFPKCPREIEYVPSQQSQPATGYVNVFIWRHMVVQQHHCILSMHGTLIWPFFLSFFFKKNLWPSFSLLTICQKTVHRYSTAEGNDLFTIQYTQPKALILKERTQETKQPHSKKLKLFIYRRSALLLWIHLDDPHCIKQAYSPFLMCPYSLVA